MQPKLFHETLNDALVELVGALGGAKKVGAAIRPEKTVDEAARWVRDCLNADRRERFEPEHVLWLMREGRKANCHAAMDFIADSAGYECKPVDPVEEAANLQRQFIESVKVQRRMLDRLGELGAVPLKSVV